MSDISIVGLGMRGAEQLTREAGRALEASQEILYVDPSPATEAFLDALGPTTTPLYRTAYQEDGSRLSAYHMMAAAVLDAALDHPPVSFAVPGHPVVFVYATHLIRDAAALLGLSVRTFPGVSSTDCLYAELGIDPGARGILQLEATEALLRRRPLQPDLPLILWQVGTVESRLFSPRSSRPERFDRLLAYLLGAYPPDHPVISLHIPPDPSEEPVRLAFPLIELPKHAAQLHYGVTLYLRPARERPIQDLELLAELDSIAHLRAITQAGEDSL